MISKKLFLVGCVVCFCFSLFADVDDHQNGVGATQKTTELLIVEAARDSYGGLQVVEACSCTPENIIELVRMMKIPADKRQDFARGVLDAMSGQSGE
jgi:hypothetical protein